MSNTVWAANPDINKAPESYHMLFEDYPFHHAMMKGWKERMTKYVYTLEGSEKKVYDEYLFNETEFRKVPQAAQAASRAMEKYVVTFSFSNFGGLQTVGDAPLSDANLDILSRFGKVFDLTYTRFNDLKQAEAQAREAQIEAALERVRSRTMAMQRSQELMQAAELLFQQVQSLGVTLWGCSFNFWETGDTEFTCYWGSPDSAKYSTWKIPLMEEARFIHFHESRQRGDEFWYEEISGEEIKAHYRYMLTIPGLGEDLKKMLEAGFAFPTFQINHLVNFSHGNLIFITYQPVPEAHDIFKRFGKVFEQTYTRFLDLQKAEEQARESQIEAALERVRSRSMGMQKSEELRDVIQVIYEQLLHLNFNIDSAGFAMDYRDSDDWNLWMVDRNGPYPNLLHIPYFDHPMANAIIESKKNGDELLVISLTFEEKNKLWDQFFKYVTVPEEAKEALYSSPGFFMSKALFRNVDLFIQNYTGISCSDAENATLIRFGKVFEQTYIRFNDLKQAEAQALEAIKRASVDRVRAEIASMRTTTDLERITPLIWNELTTLGVPFIRCGVFIMDEEQQQVQTLLSTPDGKAIATLHVPFEFNLSIITNGVHYWRKKKVYTEHWDAAAFTKAWVALSSLRETSMDSPQTEHPPENLYLHMLPFLQGMLYVGNDAPLNEDELHLVQNLADAFATAYARYEDFNKLESANIKIEKTLVDLKQTQAQLVQSEKMASLGELTAGIAHEIQNPLNFVNNFSEVSKELLDEMKEELDKGNTADAKEIAEDVIQNLEKINHHGKRADAIVKGMLQHSRSSTGVKEPTDINALTDEYLRLAFHGLRAKDKSFNANIKTDYDETIGKINIIPQDIGRVLLNLYNNAFYAVTERKKQQPENYEPTVSVSSKKIGDKVILTVTDNGNGIPQKVIDKIFQPFFTTKPTGEGTGLGLSLSYDIMKAHGGDIKVETKEGEGSEFIIMLPVV
jgi:signal transduction histidine kinase